MALINCKECGKEISDKAKECPYCGISYNNTKYCKYCGENIDQDSIICPKCGKQIEQLEETKNIVINNNNNAYATNVSQPTSRNEKNKWVALLLCIFTVFGHKFYEGKILMGVVYLFTCGLCGVGWIFDIISLIMKPNPYYV